MSRFILPVTIGAVTLFIAVQAFSLWLQQHRAAVDHGPSCLFSLRHVSIALHQYQEEFGTFPPAVVRDGNGNPMHSWRTLILPYLEHQEVYDAYDFSKPWNALENQAARDEFYSWNRFGCWKCGEKHGRTPDTVIVAVVGADTAWPPDRCISLDDVSDVQAATIQVVAVSESGINWFEPRDYSVSEIPRESAHGDGILVELVDGTVTFLPSKEFSRAFFTIDAGDHVSQDAFKPGSDYRF